MKIPTYLSRAKSLKNRYQFYIPFLLKFWKRPSNFMYPKSGSQSCSHFGARQYAVNMIITKSIRKSESFSHSIYKMIHFHPFQLFCRYLKTNFVENEESSWNIILGNENLGTARILR